MGGQFFAYDILDVLTVMEVSGKIDPTGKNRGHPERIGIVEETFPVRARFQLKEGVFRRPGDEQAVFKEMKTHFGMVRNPALRVGIVDSKLSQNPSLRSRDVHRNVRPVNAAAPQRAYAGIILQETFLVFNTFQEGEFVLVSLPHEFQRGILGE